MIIIRSDETQSLPQRTALPNRQYAGEGAGLAQAGQQVTTVAARGVGLMAQLDDQFARLEGIQKGKQFHSELQDGANAFFEKWDQDVKKNSTPPDESVSAFEAWFIEQENSPRYQAGTAQSTNPYSVEAHKTALQDVHTNVMAKVRPYARTQYIAQGKERAGNELDHGTDLALMAEAQGDHEGYLVQAQNDLAYIDKQVGTIYTKDDAAKVKAAYAQNLETKRAFQVVARNPKQFLDAYENNEFGRLDPKVAKELVTSADAHLKSQVDQQDRTRRLDKENSEFVATTIKNELLTLAAKDPSAAMTQVLSQGNRLALGKEFDNTLSTIRTMANPSSQIDDKNTVREFNRTIELDPSKDAYKSLDKAFQSGRLKESTYLEMSHRLSERIEKFQDKAVQERTRLTKEAIGVYQPMLRVTGINDFDKMSNSAMQGLEEELILNLQANPKLNAMEEGNRLMQKYRTYVTDNAMNVAENVNAKYGFKSPDEVLKAYQSHTITKTESDMILWWMKTEATTSKPAASGGSGMVKKK